MNELHYFKIECSKCGQHIDGEMEGFERLIQCPTCSAYVLARPTEQKPTSVPESVKLNLAIRPAAADESKAEDIPKVHCRCPRCKEDFTFELGLLGDVIH